MLGIAVAMNLLTIEWKVVSQATPFSAYSAKLWEKGVACEAKWKVGVVFSNARSTDCFAPERPTATKLGLTNNRLTAPMNEL